MSGSNKLVFGNLTLGEFFDAAYKAASANLPAGAKLKILGKQLSKPQVLAELEKRKKRYEDADKARTQLQELVATREAAEPEAQSFADGYAAAIKAEFGTSPTIDATYGVPRKQPRRQRSAQEKVQASAKAIATRGLRHTMGPRAKEAIKATGDFSVTVGSASSTGDAGSSSASTATPTLPPIAAAPAPVVSAAPAPSTTPTSSSGDSAAVPSGSNGVSDGSVAPMLMNGAGH
ncbi:MAG: hypothetical protein JST54_17845 [Deltaproteobacteria bacterium]|nr:hypothetical protein [Deltaproteobacteria bacterium]